MAYDYDRLLEEIKNTIRRTEVYVDRFIRIDSLYWQGQLDAWNEAKELVEELKRQYNES